MVGGDPAACERSNRWGMRSTLAALLPGRGDRPPGSAVRGGFDSDALVGVLVAAAPDGFPFPLPPWWTRLACLVGQGPRVAERWAEVYETLLSRQPPEPHHTLCLLGVSPDCRRGGVGRRLLGDWLAQVDRLQPAPVHLETDVEQNLAFYAGDGFEPIADFRVFGVPVWSLRRPARSI